MAHLFVISETILPAIEQKAFYMLKGNSSLTGLGTGVGNKHGNLLLEEGGLAGLPRYGKN